MVPFDEAKVPNAQGVHAILPFDDAKYPQAHLMHVAEELAPVAELADLLKKNHFQKLFCLVFYK